MTTAWRIHSWDRARGRGSIACGGTFLEFDASIALVDDFEVGEGVHVHLAPQGSTFRVTKIWPDDPRVATPTDDRVVPALDESTEMRLREVLARMPVYVDYRIGRLEAGDLFVEADELLFEHGPWAVLRFHRVGYVELPYAWSGKAFRLANERERVYAASRCEVGRTDAVIKIVDEELHPYLVTCADFSFAEVARRR